MPEKQLTVSFNTNPEYLNCRPRLLGTLMLPFERSKKKTQNPPNTPTYVHSHITNTYTHKYTGALWYTQYATAQISDLLIISVCVCEYVIC